MTNAVDGIVFDLDGTVYLGDGALPGAVETVAYLRNRGVRVLFVTNKPLQSRADYADKLTRLGIPTPADDVITSTYVLGYHLAQHHPDLSYYVVGEQPLRDELRDFGLNIVADFDDQSPQEVIDTAGVDAVIVAFDRTFDYRKFNTAYQALRSGARFFATNADKVCPMPGGGIPDAGGVIVALEHISGRKLELLAGKPSTLMMQVALSKIALPPERCMMVGDRLETDIFMGQQAGMLTAVVLTGVTTREDVALMNTPPDYVLENVGEIPEVVFGESV
jgi:NagD protein